MVLTASEEQLKEGQRINMQSNIPCVQLIDFGVSIDLKLFPKGTTFKKERRGCN
ncbi:hypothetical protein pipiens_014082 [Culex pipiens pipiens]|uniref:Uncharacterized protein n=1 Tax=Culex pipiens pipiens TaxID=38569 RepID=A0ABD1CVX2_CULPP